jgi:hypothetical protein
VGDYPAVIVSIHISTWIFLENIMLSEKTDTQPPQKNSAIRKMDYPVKVWAKDLNKQLSPEDIQLENKPMKR